MLLTARDEFSEIYVIINPGCVCRICQEICLCGVKFKEVTYSIAFLSHISF